MGWEPPVDRFRSCGVDGPVHGRDTGKEERRRYELVLDDVTQWHSSRGVPLPWRYAELTEVHVSEVGDQVLVDLVMWSDETTLSARCSRVRVARLA